MSARSEEPEETLAPAIPMDEVSVWIRSVAAPDPCIMLGCVHEYGHEGEHEYQATPW